MHPTGYQEVEGLIPAVSANIFFVETDYEIFSMFILSLPLITDLMKGYTQVLFNHLED